MLLKRLGLAIWLMQEFMVSAEPIANIAAEVCGGPGSTLSYLAGTVPPRFYYTTPQAFPNSWVGFFPTKDPGRDGDSSYLDYSYTRDGSSNTVIANAAGQANCVSQGNYYAFLFCYGNRDKPLAGPVSFHYPGGHGHKCPYGSCTTGACSCPAGERWCQSTTACLNNNRQCNGQCPTGYRQCLNGSCSTKACPCQENLLHNPSLATSSLRKVGWGAISVPSWSTAGGRAGDFVFFAPDGTVPAKGSPTTWVGFRSYTKYSRRKGRFHQTFPVAGGKGGTLKVSFKAKLPRTTVPGRDGVCGKYGANSNTLTMNIVQHNNVVKRLYVSASDFQGSTPISKSLEYTLTDDSAPITVEFINPYDNPANGCSPVFTDVQAALC
ncbi:hypothetical protein V493_08046 [Pseudogymnoascus sp. VKM F-4281 (FW-2241)]|nr:hypothetical protein V493_08046 [Pseudogymnoascus sp. VKM F-4281 (FW-2241)]